MEAAPVLQTNIAVISLRVLLRMRLAVKARVGTVMQALRVVGKHVVSRMKRAVEMLFAVLAMLYASLKPPQDFVPQGKSVSIVVVVMVLIVMAHVVLLALCVLTIAVVLWTMRAGHYSIPTFVVILAKCVFLENVALMIKYAD